MGVATHTRLFLVNVSISVVLDWGSSCLYPFCTRLFVVNSSISFFGVWLWQQPIIPFIPREFVYSCSISLWEHPFISVHSMWEQPFIPVFLFVNFSIFVVFTVGAAVCTRLFVVILSLSSVFHYGSSRLFLVNFSISFVFDCWRTVYVRLFFVNFSISVLFYCESSRL